MRQGRWVSLLSVSGVSVGSHLQALHPAFEEHEERRVRVDRLPALEDGLGLNQARLSVRAIEGEEGLHYRMVPQEGQPATGAQMQDELENATRGIPEGSRFS